MDLQGMILLLKATVMGLVVTTVEGVDDATWRNHIIEMVVDIEMWRVCLTEVCGLRIEVVLVALHQMRSFLKMIVIVAMFLLIMVRRGTEGMVLQIDLTVGVEEITIDQTRIAITGDEKMTAISTGDEKTKTDTAEEIVITVDSNLCTDINTPYQVNTVSCSVRRSYLLWDQFSQVGHSQL